MTSFLYNIGIALYGIGLFLASFFNGKAKLWVRGRKRWKDRVLQISKEKKPVPLIWMHVSSLGEFEQASPIMESLRQQKFPCQILLTFFSPSGYEIQKEYNNADWVMYMPLDTPGNARFFIGTLKPSIALFAKYDVWPNFIRALKKRSIPMFLFSALFRKSQIYFNPFFPFFKNTLAFFDRIYVQNMASQNLLQSIGINHTHILGDTRIDRVLQIKNKAISIDGIKAFQQNSKLLILGSSYAVEEDMVFKNLPLIKENNYKIIIAPHHTHPENINRLMKVFGSDAIAYTHLQNDPTAGNKSLVLLIDRIGLLSQLYHYATAAFIGGGFKNSIHNTLEPSVFGVPICFGPAFKKFEEAIDFVEKGTAKVIHDEKDFKAWLTLMDNEKYLLKVKQNLLQYFEEKKGSAAQLTAEIIKYLDGK